MSKDRIAMDVEELLIEAAEARQFAATFQDTSTVRDLLNYASALEHEAAQLAKETGVLSSPRPETYQPSGTLQPELAPQGPRATASPHASSGR